MSFLDCAKHTDANVREHVNPDTRTFSDRRRLLISQKMDYKTLREVQAINANPQDAAEYIAARERLLQMINQYEDKNSCRIPGRRASSKPPNLTISMSCDKVLIDERLDDIMGLYYCIHKRLDETNPLFALFDVHTLLPRVDKLVTNPDAAYDDDLFFVLQYGSEEDCALMLFLGLDYIQKESLNRTGEYKLSESSLDTLNAALDGAILMDDTARMEFLLERGADPNGLNVFGNTPVDHALNSDSPTCLEILLNSPGTIINGDIVRVALASGSTRCCKIILDGHKTVVQDADFMDVKVPYEITHQDIRAVMASTSVEKCKLLVERTTTEDAVAQLGEDPVFTYLRENKDQEEDECTPRLVLVDAFRLASKMQVMAIDNYQFYSYMKSIGVDLPLKCLAPGSQCAAFNVSKSEEFATIIRTWHISEEVDRTMSQIYNLATGFPKVLLEVIFGYMDIFISDALTQIKKSGTRR